MGTWCLSVTQWSRQRDRAVRIAARIESSGIIDLLGFFDPGDFAGRGACEARSRCINGMRRVMCVFMKAYKTERSAHE